MTLTGTQSRQHGLLAVVTTTPTRAQAVEIARALVKRKLAACAQISQIQSIYLWNGELQQGQEFRLVLKTTIRQYHAVERAIRDLHTYDIPAIFAMEVSEAYNPYAAWVHAGSAGSVPDAEA